MKTLIFDNVFEGHHLVYMNTLATIDYVENHSRKYDFYNGKLNIRKYVNQRLDFFKYCFSFKENNVVIHLLYIDVLYNVSFFLKKPRGNFKILGTLHHFPNSLIKQKLLKEFCSNIDLLIVHSKYIGENLEKIGIYNYKVVDYPVFHDNYKEEGKQHEFKSKLAISNDYVVISALGGTRHDKGLDILLEAFKYIPVEYKQKILLNISGKEITFQREYIEQKLKEYNIQSRLMLGYVSDEEFEINIKASDAVILPYRKGFMGNSGPMTEAVYNGIPVIGPEEGNLGYLIKRYDLGYSFKCEDPRDLALQIQKFIKNGWSPNVNSKKYSQSISKEAFLENHSNIYKSLEQGADCIC